MSILNKILDISKDKTYLSFNNNLLIIKNNQEELSIPINELSVVIISNYSTTVSHRVLSECGKNNVSLIVCDEKFIPSSLMIPFCGNFQQTERFKLQSEMSVPLKKNIWGNIVISKMLSQSENLIRFYGKDWGIKEMSKHVNSGDGNNLEAQAAVIYWKRIFNNDKFVRDRNKNDQNTLLNYGYMVLRSIISRSICANGLHPTFGIHHHNQFDAFCLADDLMEPFRFIIDYFVVRYLNNNNKNIIDKEFKKQILTFIMSDFLYENNKTSIFNICNKICCNFVNSIYAKKCQINPPIIKIINEL